MNKKLRDILESIKSRHKVRREGISVGFITVVSIVLSYILFSIIASIFNLSQMIRYALIAGVSIVVSFTISLKPRLVITLVCVMLAFISFIFVAISLNPENIEQIGWDASLLGAGTSLLAIAIALYALMRTTGRKEDVLNLKRSGRDINNLDSEEGYKWIEEIK